MTITRPTNAICGGVNATDSAIWAPPYPRARQCRKANGSPLDKTFIQATFRADLQSASRRRERVEADPF